MIPAVLSIAASDSSGAAGMQADLKTFAARGVYGLSALTGLTVQDSNGVKQAKLVEPEFISAQIKTVLADIQVGAIKTGLLFTTGIITAVAEAIRPLPTPNLIVDPVLVAGDGRRITSDDAIQAYRDHLFPHALLITPNLIEAAILTGKPVTTIAEMKIAAERLADQGIRNVLIKGGHLDEHYLEHATQHNAEQGMVDILLADGVIYALESEYLPVNNPRGTGCTLASCIAAELAKGALLPQAVATAHAYVAAAIRAAIGWKMGHGRGTVHHGVWNGL